MAEEPVGFDRNDPSPDWNEGGRVHNWRRHVGAHTREIWSTLTPAQRLAIALDADEEASAEEWD